MFQLIAFGEHILKKGRLVVRIYSVFALHRFLKYENGEKFENMFLYSSGIWNFLMFLLIFICPANNFLERINIAKKSISYFCYSYTQLFSCFRCQLLFEVFMATNKRFGHFNSASAAATSQIISGKVQTSTEKNPALSGI